jgi:hypothetical protein
MVHFVTSLEKFVTQKTKVIELGEGIQIHLMTHTSNSVVGLQNAKYSTKRGSK